MNQNPRLAQGAALLATCLLTSVTALGQNGNLELDGDSRRTRSGLVYAYDLDSIGVSLSPVVGDFTGDLRPDLLACLGNQPYVSISIGSMNLESDLSLPSNATEVKALGKVDLDALDVPAMLGSLDTTLVVWTIDPNSGAISRQEPHGGVDWANARSLHSADVDGDGQQELIGLFSTGGSSTIRVGEWSGDPTVPNSLGIVERNSLGLAAHLTLIDTADLASSSGGDEIIFAYNDRVGILSDTFQWIDFHILGEDAICSCPIMDSKGVGLAFVTRDSSGSDDVVVIRPTFIPQSPTFVEAPTDVGNFQVHAMVASDMLVGGLADLALLGTELVVLRNNATGVGATYEVPSNGTPFDHDNNLLPYSYDSPWIVAGDFDNDGDGDISWLWRTATNEPYLFVTFNDTIHEGEEGIHVDLTYGEFQTPATLGQPTLLMGINRVNDLLLDGYTHVQMVLMVTPEGGVMSAYTSQTLLVSGVNDDMNAELTYLRQPGTTVESFQLFLRPVSVSSNEIVDGGPDLRMQTYASFEQGTGWQIIPRLIGSIPGDPLPGPPDPRGDDNGDPPPGTRG